MKTEKRTFCNDKTVKKRQIQSFAQHTHTQTPLYTSTGETRSIAISEHHSSSARDDTPSGGCVVEIINLHADSSQQANILYTTRCHTQTAFDAAAQRSFRCDRYVCGRYAACSCDSWIFLHFPFWPGIMSNCCI